MLVDDVGQEEVDHDGDADQRTDELEAEADDRAHEHRRVDPSVGEGPRIGAIEDLALSHQLLLLVAAHQVGEDDVEPTELPGQPLQNADDHHAHEVRALRREGVAQDAEDLAGILDDVEDRVGHAARGHRDVHKGQLHIEESPQDDRLDHHHGLVALVELGRDEEDQWRQLDDSKGCQRRQVGAQELEPLLILVFLQRRKRPDERIPVGGRDAKTDGNVEQKREGGKRQHRQEASAPGLVQGVRDVLPDDVAGLRRLDGSHLRAFHLCVGEQALVSARRRGQGSEGDKSGVRRVRPDRQGFQRRDGIPKAPNRPSHRDLGVVENLTDTCAPNSRRAVDRGLAHPGQNAGDEVGRPWLRFLLLVASLLARRLHRPVVQVALRRRRLRTGGVTSVVLVQKLVLQGGGAPAARGDKRQGTPLPTHATMLRRHGRCCVDYPPD
mmetsp:Transcript_8009/g.29963  ORF Transcript_8009/g.29963 Transcript_8009/m.29963 type:complete len:439 (-) Transcript_8009:1716-3032(-)